MSLSGIASAWFKSPEIIPLKGQDSQEQEKDIQTAHDLAVEATGVDPSYLDLRMKSLQFRSRRYKNYYRRGDSFYYNERYIYRETREIEEEMNDIRKQQKKYQKAFIEEIEAMGYEVK
jgi:hypothetical protein